MKTKLRNLITHVISGEWGDEDTNGIGVNIIRTTNFNNDGSIDFSNIESRVILKKEKNEEGKDTWKIDTQKIEQKKLHNEDIIIEKSGGGPNSPVGRVVYFTNPNNSIYLSNNFTQVLRVDKEKIYPKYFFYYLRYLYARRVVKKYQNQTTGLLNLKLDRYLNENIKVPPFDIQASIVSQLNLIQDIINKKKAILKIIESSIFSFYIELFGHPISNIKKHKTRLLSEIGNWKSGGTPKTNNAEYYNGNIPWFTSGELGELYVTESIKLVTQKAIDSSETRKIKPNSILIGMYDTAAFKMSINEKECTSNQAIISAKLFDDFYTIFIYYTLLLSKDYYLARRKGVRQQNLNANFIRNIRVIYPDNQEDKEDILKFYSLHSLLYQQQKRIKKSIFFLENIFSSILKNTFNENAEINEEPIFKELINQLKLEDLKGNKKRLQYLINLFDENKFEDDKTYSSAKEKLFELILVDEIEQVFDEDKIKLEVKKHEAS